MTDDTLMTRDYPASYVTEIERMNREMERERAVLEAVPLIRARLHGAIGTISSMRQFMTGNEDLMLMADGVLDLLQELYRDLLPDTDGESDPNHVIDETG